MRRMASESAWGAFWAKTEVDTERKKTPPPAAGNGQGKRTYKQRNQQMEKLLSQPLKRLKWLKYKETGKGVAGSYI